MEEFSFLCFDDLQTALPTVPVFRLRILEAAAQFVSLGHEIVAETTAQHIKLTLAEAKLPKSAATPPATTAPTASPGRAAASAIRTPLNCISEFSGDPIDFEQWDIETRATLGQTPHSFLLNRAPIASGSNSTSEMRQNTEFYNMLVNSMSKGSGYHLLTAVSDNDGHKAWTQIQEYYSSESSVALIIQHYQGKLKDLVLDDDHTASEVINEFILCHQKLEKHDEGYTDKAKCRQFLDLIQHDDYLVVKTLVETQIDTIKIQSLLRTIRGHELNLSRDSASRNNSGATNRRGKPKVHEDGGARKPDSNLADTPLHIPSFPKFIYNELKGELRENLLNWRRSVNSTGKNITSKEELLGKRKSTEGESGTRTSPDDKSQSKGKRKKGRNRRSHTVITSTSSFGSKDPDSARVRFYSDEEAEPSQHSDGEDEIDHEDKQLDPTQLTDDGDKSGSNSVRRGIARRGRTGASTIVLDSGCEVPVIGGSSWHIIHEHTGVKMHLSGPTPGLGTQTYSTADGVTSVLDSNGKTLLLGVKDATYNPDQDQEEALLNPYQLQENGIDVCVCPKSFGGRQSILLGDNILDLHYDRSKSLMTLQCRLPTKKEIDSLPIVWISDNQNALSSTSRREHSVAPTTDTALVDVGSPTSKEKDDPSTISKDTVNGMLKWKENLAYPSEEILSKTMEATTQHCAAPVEMETRILPRQHRKPRVLPLHPRRLKGRTDTDTFFSSIPSIRNFKCVQLFVATAYNFLFVRCLQREKQSHTGYQDYIREVGAPTVLLADNSKTQNGKKWTKTSRDYAIQQKNSVPHNQNQNSSERKIQEVKKKTVHALRTSCAPLVFWCYCLKFVVDCLNHTASARTGWRTPMELYSGDTPDISMFRFEFWQAVEVFDNPAPFPSPKMIDARFIGIAWDHGDPFTYRVWTEPNGDWKKGTELIRNFVRPRRTATLPTISNDDYETFKLQKAISSRKRKRSSTKGDDDIGDRILKDVDDLPHSEESIDIMNLVPTDPSSSSQLLADTDSSLNSNESSQLGDIEMDNEINDHLNTEESVKHHIGGATLQRIVGHRWKEGYLQLQVQWSANDSSWEDLRDMKLDRTCLTADYLLANADTIQRLKRQSEPCLTWARKTVRDLNRAICRIIHNYDFSFDEHHEVKCVRRSVKNNKKRKKLIRECSYKYGVKVPRNVKEALAFDKANGNNFW